MSSMCFASPATLADGIGLYEDKADEEVVKRIARGAAVGIIKPSYQKVMGQERDQLVLEIDFQRVKELAFEMEEYRNSQKVSQTPMQISLRESKIKEALLNYLQNYIPDYSSNHLSNNPPDYPPDQSQNHSPDYPAEQLEKPVPEDKPREVKRAYQNPDSPGASAASSMSREERGTGEEDSVSSVSHTGKNEVLPPHVAGGHATAKDIFETHVKPLMQDHGWTYADIDAVVEEATGQRQKIKDIATQEQRDAVYQMFEYYSMTGEKPEKKGGQSVDDCHGEHVSIAELMDLAKTYVELATSGYNPPSKAHVWENEIPKIVEGAVGEDVLIKEISDQTHRCQLKEDLLWYIEQEKRLNSLPIY